MYGHADWVGLPLVGYQPVVLEDDRCLLELRNCPCRSTLAVYVATTDLIPLLEALLFAEAERERALAQLEAAHARIAELERQATEAAA